MYIYGMLIHMRDGKGITHEVTCQWAEHWTKSLSIQSTWLLTEVDKYIVFYYRKLTNYNWTIRAIIEHDV